jgi:hypothetical protein
MAPSVQAETPAVQKAHTTLPAGKAQPTASQTLLKEPLKLKGVLDQYESFDVTPVIGREFPKANLKEWLRAPNSDELLRDLAITGKYTNPKRGMGQVNNNGINQSLNEEWCSSANKTTWTMIFRRSWLTD